VPDGAPAFSSATGKGEGQSDGAGRRRLGGGLDGSDVASTGEVVCIRVMVDGEDGGSGRIGVYSEGGLRELDGEAEHADGSLAVLSQRPEGAERGSVSSTATGSALGTEIGGLSRAEPGDRDSSKARSAVAAAR